MQAKLKSPATEDGRKLPEKSIWSLRIGSGYQGSDDFTYADALAFAAQGDEQWNIVCQSLGGSPDECEFNPFTGDKTAAAKFKEGAELIGMIELGIGALAGCAAAAAACAQGAAAEIMCDFCIGFGTAPVRVTGGAANVASALRLRDQLAVESAKSAFKPTGALRPETVQASTRIIPGDRINNPAVIKELTSHGGNISDWGKYTTQTFQSPAGNFQVHFYYNPSIGMVNYNRDYKIVFNAR